LRLVERACLLVVSLIAVTELCAWMLPSFGAHLPDVWKLMGANTPVGLLLGVASLTLAAPQRSPWQRRSSRVLAGMVLLLGLATVLEYVLDTSLGIDALFAGASYPDYDPRMSQPTAWGFLLLGLLLPWSHARRGMAAVAADAMTLILVAFALAVFAGKLFGAVHMYGELPKNPLSPQAVLCWMLLTLAICIIRIPGGMFSILLGDRIGSRIARIAIPLAILFLLALSLLRAYAVSAGWLTGTSASAMVISFICFSVSCLILLMAWRINLLEQAVRELMQRQSDARVAESEQRYADAIEQSINGFVIRRADGRLLLVNEAYRKMTGYSREELLQLNARDLVVDQGVIERAQRLKPGDSVHIETFMKQKGGNLLEVQYVTQRLRNGDLQSFLLDVSERKRLQKAHSESEQRYAELVDQALEGITVRKPDGGFVFVNDTFCRMLGYSREELMQLNIGDVVHTADLDTLQQVQQLGHGGRVRVYKRMRRKDGGVIHVEVSAKRLNNGDIQTTVQDISERKDAELRFRAMVDGAPNAMIMVDQQGMIALVNPQTEKLFGYGRDELLGKSVELLIPDRYRAGHPRLRSGYNHDPRIRSMGVGRDLFGLRKDGREVPVEIGLNPITTPEGPFVLASIIDITERRAAEEREHAYAEELRQMSRRLSEAQETERRSIARELHDEVGQALTATRINLKDLQQQAGDGPLASRLADSETVVAELLAKVRQMSLDLHPSVLDDLGLAPALRWCVRTRTVGSDLQVSLDLPEDLPRFEGMAEITLFRVFQETLSNVLKHAGATQLQVRLEYADERLVMTARDDGKGFDAEAARREALSGKSLGLLGMQERVRLAGGEIELSSTPGQGAEIRVSLPAILRGD